MTQRNNIGFIVLAALPLVPLAIYFLLPQLFSLKGLLLGPPLLCALLMLADNTIIWKERPPNHLWILAGLFAGFCAWLILTTLAHLSAWHSYREWADFVLLRSGAPRSIHTQLAFGGALLFALAFVPPLQWRGQQFVRYVETTISKNTFLSKDKASEIAQARIDSEQEES